MAQQAGPLAVLTSATSQASLSALRTAPSPPTGEGAPGGPDTPPRVLAGRYRIERLLGRGGTAAVYQATDTHLGGQRAIKVLRQAHLTSETSRARMEGEARIMAQLRHPGLVTVYDLGRDEDEIFIVMELMEGGSLADRLANGTPPSEADAVQSVLHVAEALKAVHAQGIVHRDIKPANILLSRSGQPKLADFGVARLLHEDRGLTQNTQPMGTFGYMSQEQLHDPRQVDARADIYALGATLFALVTRRAPGVLTLRSQRRAALRLLPARLRRVVKRATEEHPASRYESAEAFIAALQAAQRRPGLPQLATAVVSLGVLSALAWSVLDRVGAESGAVESVAATGEAVPPGMGMRIDDAGDDQTPDTPAPSSTTPEPSAEAELEAAMVDAVDEAASPGAPAEPLQERPVSAPRPSGLAVASPSADATENPSPSTRQGPSVAPSSSDAASNGAALLPPPQAAPGGALSPVFLNAVGAQRIEVLGAGASTKIPWELSLTPGRYTVIISGEGGARLEREIDVRSGERLTRCWDLNSMQRCSVSRPDELPVAKATPSSAAP